MIATFELDDGNPMSEAQTRSRYMARCGEAAIPVMERQPNPGSVTLLALEPDLMSLSGDESRAVGCSIARVDQGKLTGPLQ